ncbi:MAG: hypothetical protein ACI9ON_003436 [Limisphaerales bacterium]|jgi:hypothetical protein
MKRPQALYGPPNPAQDHSSWSLLGANLVTLVMAYFLSWQLADLLVVYWFQSIVIGGSYVLRILNLDKFSTQNLRINGRSVAATTETKRKIAGFFCIHFGIFHLAYWVFIFNGVISGDTPNLDLGLLVCCLAFLVNHCYSYMYFRDKDREGCPNVGTMMFTPYLRVIPMHLTVLLGGAFAGTGLFLFMILKTISDVLMHWVEHKMMHRANSPNYSPTRE